MRPVVWTDAARTDYLAILHYIAQDDPGAAEKVVDTIERTADGLGEVVSGRPGRIAGTYEKSVPRLRYVIAYALHEQAGRESVVILRVIHTARDWRSRQWPR